MNPQVDAAAQRDVGAHTAPTFTFENLGYVEARRVWYQPIPIDGLPRGRGKIVNESVKTKRGDTVSSCAEQGVGRVKAGQRFDSPGGVKAGRVKAGRVKARGSTARAASRGNLTFDLVLIGLQAGAAWSPLCF